MRPSSITPRDLEHMLCDETADPKALPLSLLDEITDGFSHEKEIGRGAFAEVYKGKLENRTVAVKKMTIPYMYEKQFHREVECLMTAKHKNVVRFLGYCADTQGTIARHGGKFIMADKQQRLLCFEYLPKGSLREYITDMSPKSRWRDCYQIITGICQGLHYLHQENIAHLDLKPENILLDDNLVAKIGDFGLSRCFIGEAESRVISQIGGTPGYWAPEIVGNPTQVKNRDLRRLDIYSLGVVILEILTRNNYYLVIMETLTGKKQDYYHVVDDVVESWSNMVEQSQRDKLLEQVRVCAEIGIACINVNQANRPDAHRIINTVDGTETMDDYIKTGLVTSQQAEKALNEQHKGLPNSPGETSSKENVIPVTVEEGTNLDKLNKTLHSLNLDLRRCIEFCSIFPKGSKLRRDDLVRLWIAQGFVKMSYATEDMEERARCYIQDLVSVSFLEAIGNSSDTQCFTVNGAVHDILDKVATKCFRIENARSNRGRIHQLMFGNLWKGDVPRDTQHLLIQHYDEKLITKTIIGLEYLRTLIVYIVGKDKPIEEKVIESICKRLPKLRVLAIAFSQEHDPIEQPKFLFPQSVGQLEYLRYLAFRANMLCNITLPSTINKLRHIQLLDFGDGRIAQFTFAELVNLRHIFCWSHVKLPYIGRLSSLQKLQDFEVSNEQGCELKQLRDLNKIQGKLCILALENVKSKAQALQANLTAKERLTELKLSWNIDDEPRCSPEVIADILEGLCPPVGLTKLDIWSFAGSRYPDWMVGKHSGGPKYLQELNLWVCSQPVPPSGLAEAFPHLRVLEIWYCSWDALPGNMEHLTSLKKLGIHHCKNIRSLPSLPQSLEKFTLRGCNAELTKSCQAAGHPNWEKIEHIPKKVIW